MLVRRVVSSPGGDRVTESGLTAASAAAEVSLFSGDGAAKGDVPISTRSALPCLAPPPFAPPSPAPAPARRGGAEGGGFSGGAAFAFSGAASRFRGAPGEGCGEGCGEANSKLDSSPHRDDPPLPAINSGGVSPAAQLISSPSNELISSFSKGVLAAPSRGDPDSAPTTGDPGLRAATRGAPGKAGEPGGLRGERGGIAGGEISFSSRSARRFAGGDASTVLPR
eukprot:1182688-Prorocentrum_minimum.AAC.1